MAERKDAKSEANSSAEESVGTPDTLDRNRLVADKLGPNTHNPIVDPSQSDLDSQNIAAGIAGPGDKVSFIGYVGDTIEHGGTSWTVLYLDWDLSTWLLIETAGIFARKYIPNYTGMGAPVNSDVLWVLAEAAVGRGRKALSVEGMFLTGEFTRAGDFDAAAGGGTMAASTGVFCEGRSPGCCKPKTPKG
jgi:hypothetical protein